jgi:hypothetical protein
MAGADKDPSDVNGDHQLSALLAETPELWQVVEGFVGSLPERADALQDALREQAFDRLLNIARELRQASHDHGCKIIAEKAGAVEQAAHDRALETLEVKLRDLSDLIVDIKIKLQNSGK